MRNLKPGFCFRYFLPSITFHGYDEHMFSEVELVRDVAIYAKGYKGLISNRLILYQLLQDLLSEKASEEHGYFLAITGLKSIGEKKPPENECHGEISFPVRFNCRTFLPVKGETLQGVVHRVFWRGVFLSCGPIKYAFLSARKMPNYHYVPLENPFFEKEDLSRIDIGVVVRFVVLAVRCIERGNKRRDFQLLATIEGDSLGPISLTGQDEPDM